jgi:hypothetical protein
VTNGERKPVALSVGTMVPIGIVLSAAIATAGATWWWRGTLNRQEQAVLRIEDKLTALNKEMERLVSAQERQATNNWTTNDMQYWIRRARWLNPTAEFKLPDAKE